MFFPFLISSFFTHIISSIDIQVMQAFVSDKLISFLSYEYYCHDELEIDILPLCYLLHSKSLILIVQDWSQTWSSSLSMEADLHWALFIDSCKPKAQFPGSSLAREILAVYFYKAH